MSRSIFRPRCRTHSRRHCQAITSGSPRWSSLSIKRWIPIAVSSSSRRSARATSLYLWQSHLLLNPSRNRYGYNVIEDRWAYNIEPRDADRIKKAVSTFTKKRQRFCLSRLLLRNNQDLVQSSKSRFASSLQAEPRDASAIKNLGSKSDGPNSTNAREHVAGGSDQGFQ